MALKTNNLGAGASVGDGNTITTGNSDDTGEAALSQAVFTSGSGVYDDDDAPTGLAWSALISCPASGSPQILGLADTGANSWAIRYYMKISAAPGVSGSVGMRSQTSAAGQGAKGYLDTNRKLQIVGGFGTTTSSGTSVPTGQWNRFEMTCSGNGTTASFTHSWYVEHATSASDTINANGVSYTLDGAEFRFGNAQTNLGTALTIQIAGLAINVGSSTPIGPYSPPVSAGWTYGTGFQIGTV